VIGEHELLYRIGDLPAVSHWSTDGGPTARDAQEEEDERDEAEDEREEEREGD
jgi:hypothetical protein